MPNFHTATDQPVAGHSLPSALPALPALIEFPKVRDNRGNLTFIENLKHIPFAIRRVYYLYDVPAGEKRGGHAHKSNQECIVPVSGSFTVVLDDGHSRQSFFLNRPNCGLYVPTSVWRELESFSAGSMCLVLASEEYDESDYYRDYGDFLASLRHPASGPLS
jgi:dTDP-4-dehydrorhamnose 3,5-epimerase-like enzyme